MGKPTVNTSSHHFNPIQGCSRCGASKYNKLQQQQPQRRVPGWFYGSRSLAELSKIPSLCPKVSEHLGDSVQYEERRAGKVQEWLQKCDRSNRNPANLENRMSQLMQGRAELGRNIYETAEDKETRKKVQNWLDSSEKSKKSFSVKSDLELHLSHKYSKKMPLNSRFSRYLSNDGDLFNSPLRRHVGPIQRPHTPVKDLFERQKMKFGVGTLNAAKRSSFVDISHMKDKTAALKSELQTMLTD